MQEPNETAAKLLGSLLLFTQVFYKLRTGREFHISEPVGRESHYITICKALTRVFRGESTRLIINVPPRYGKTELLIHFCAWALARHPDSNFLYVSYSHSLAKKQTQTIRQIISMPEYRKLFGVQLSGETSAKDNFETSVHGSVYAAGAAGTITGRGAGIQGIEHFGGAIVIDDIHKPDEVTSDTIRQSVNEWYLNTLQSRVNRPNTPIIFIGQRLHEDDLAANLMKGYDGYKWETVILPALDTVGNALHPTMHSKEQLLKDQEVKPYVFASQYQQNPQPAGGGIFKTEWFRILDEEPKILSTFITVDTAETDKTYNDATVFSFWGIYKIEHFGQDSDLYGIHWLDCREDWIEPKDLENTFMHFCAECMRHKVKPKMAAIEKKSTGTHLYSFMQSIPGLHVLNFDRGYVSNQHERRLLSKTQRFLDIQPYVASKQVSLPVYGKHTPRCIEHMRKITANDTHRYDDIADTLADAVRVALIDKSVFITGDTKIEQDKILAGLAADFRMRNQARTNLWYKQ